MSRIQRIRSEDLGGCLWKGVLGRRADVWIGCVDDAFVAYLFQIIESLSDDVNDPYHYPVIRVLVSSSGPITRNVADGTSSF